MPKDLIKNIAPIVPALLTPVIAWLLSQRGASRRFKVFDNLLTRIQLVEKLHQQHEKLSAQNTKLPQILEKEVNQILTEIESIHETDKPSSTTSSIHKLSFVRRLLLIYDQMSFTGRMYKYLFYAFLIIFALLVLGIFTGATPQKDLNDNMISAAIGITLNLAVGLGFRAAAISDYVKNIKINNKTS